LPFAAQRQKATIEGTVLEPIKFIKQTARLKVGTHGVFIDGQSMALNEKLIVTVYNHIPHLMPGEKIRFPARLRPFKNFNNPGRYDYESAMKLKGFACAASVSDGRCIVPMGPGHMPFPRGVLERVQRPVRDFFRKKLNTQEYALYRALILGERQGISNELREAFNRTGLGHVLAVSGLHIGLVAWVAFFLLKGVLSRSYGLTLKTDIRRLAAFLTCFPVLGYVSLAGFQVSSQRAMIMALTFLCSLILGREKEIWSTLALAALLILAIDPHAVFSISFQLSFSAVIGILWLTPAILNRVPAPDRTKQKTILKRLYIYFTGLIAVCLSATVFLLPLIALFFHRIPLVTIPANVMVVPILGLWVIPLGLLSAVALPLSLEAADFFLQMGAWGLNGMMEIIRFWSRLPGSSVWVVTPNLFETLLFYTLIFFIFFFKRWSWAKVGFLIVAILFLADIGYWAYRVGFNKELKVTFIDVGQANAALVEFPGGKKMLIDGGGFPRDHFDVGKMVVAPFLWHSKIRNIHYLVLSHPQSDHMNGLRFIAKAFHLREFWHNGDEVETPSFTELMAIVEAKKIKKLLPADLTGGRQINGVKVEILHPRPDGQSISLFDKRSRLNNNSLVLKISYGGKSFLFPGDLERQGEKVLISNGGLSLKSDVLLSPHHGSKSSSSEDFLRMVQPRICVISSGEGNFSGFPHKQTLERLRGIGCRIIRIDQSGAIQFTVSPDQLEFKTFICPKQP
jgi:competence protein ComEC